MIFKLNTPKVAVHTPGRSASDAGRFTGKASALPANGATPSRPGTAKPSRTGTTSGGWF